MICLSFTTSSDHGSVALFKKDKVVGQISWTRKQHQSEALVSKIKALLKKYSVGFKELDLISVDSGPGSFTGVRIAVNVAKTFSYTLNKPIFFSDSLDLLCYEFSMHKRSRASFPQEAIALIDAHKFLFYFKHFKISGPGQIKSSFPPQAQSLEDISKTAFKGNKLFVIGNIPVSTKKELKDLFLKNNPQLNLEFSPERLNFPKASTLALMAALISLDKRPDKGANPIAPPLSDWLHLEPCYIRAPDAVAKLSNPTVNLKK
jgi:tRNA threonylcarbamoyl adenosine modification protein YeaZ